MLLPVSSPKVALPPRPDPCEGRCEPLDEDGICRPLDPVWIAHKELLCSFVRECEEARRLRAAAFLDEDPAARGLGGSLKG